MAEVLLHKRCFNHPDREAAARCPSCERFYCKECVTEHEGRVLCVQCLGNPAEDATSDAARGGAVMLLVQFLCTVVLLFMVFSALGNGLMSLPDEFHDGPRPFQRMELE